MDLEDTRNLFANLRENTDWDITGPLLWGYFFVHSTAEPLQALAQHLQAQGYTFVELFEQDPEEGDAPFHVLHVERVEIHDEASLDRRNQEFAALAAEKGVEDYERWAWTTPPAWPAVRPRPCSNARPVVPAAGRQCSTRWISGDAGKRPALPKPQRSFASAWPSCTGLSAPSCGAKSATPGGSSTITVEP